jgi:glutathione S-transferase
MRGVLELVRARVKAGATTILDGGFSFADITMAAAMQFVRPVEHPALKLGPATRAVWTHGKIAGEYADVLAWRDAIYARYRDQRTK